MIQKIFAVLLLGGTLAIAHGQTGDSSQSAAAVLAPLQAKQVALQNSLSLFASHDFAAGESALEAANIAAPNTADWHFESGAELLQIAALFHSLGDGATCGSVVNLALNHLLLCDQFYGTGGDAGTLASEKTMIGFVYERYFTYFPAAKKYYQAALIALPGYQQATEGLRRIGKIQATEQSRFGSGVDTGN